MCFKPISIIVFALCVLLDCWLYSYTLCDCIIHPLYLGLKIGHELAPAPLCCYDSTPFSIVCVLHAAYLCLPRLYHRVL